MKILFVTTYDPKNENLGGASWVDREVIRKLSALGDVEIFSIASKNDVHEVPLEIRESFAGKSKTLLRMAFGSEPYQEAKFKWHRNWKVKANQLKSMYHKYDYVVSSQWPAMLLLEELGKAADLHIAHNVDWVLAENYDPLIFRLIRNSKRMRRREIELLAKQREIRTLSTGDIVRLADESIFSTHLKLAESQVITTSKAKRTVGFIGKMSWPPNASAVTNLIERVIPEVNRYLEEPVRILLAGRGSENFHGSHGVTALGMIDNLEDFYNEIDMVVVPRVGDVTGVSVKLLEASMRGKPAVVPSTLVQDADIDSEMAVIADDFETMAKAIIQYYEPLDAAVDLVKRDEVKRRDLKITEKSGSINLEGSQNGPCSYSFDSSMRAISQKFATNLEELIEAVFTSELPIRVQTVNLHHLFLAKNRQDFSRVMAESDIATADGWPVVEIAKKDYGSPALERVTGSEFLRKVLEDPRIRGKKIALIGGSPSAADLFRQRLLDAGATLALAESGNKNQWSFKVIASKLSDIQTDFVFLAVTPPFGDIFADKLHRAGTPGVIVPIGGGLDMLVGKRSRAPHLLQKMGLEWTYRLVQDPRHLWKRYVLECIPLLIQMRIARWAQSLIREIEERAKN